MTTVLELLFVTRGACARFGRDLAEAGLRGSVLRGRVTASGAWMRIALCGEAEALDAFAGRWSGYTLPAA